MKSKKAMAMQELVAWILFLAIFASIIFVAGKMIEKEKLGSENLACQTQLGVAAKGNPIGFSACHSYRVEFDKNAAIKYDMYDQDRVVYEYEYDKVLAKLKVLHPELDDLEIKKDEVIPEEIVYYVFAEEVKECDSTYNIGSFKTDSYFFLYSQNKLNACQECAVFLFKEDFFPKEETSKVSFEKINMFFDGIRIDKTSEMTYSEYFNKRYDEDSVLSNLEDIKTDKIYKLIYQFEPDSSKIEGKKVPREIGVKNLLPIESWDVAIDTWDKKVDYTYNLKSSQLILVDSENFINACNINLLLLPGGVVI